MLVIEEHQAHPVQMLAQHIALIARHHHDRVGSGLLHHAHRAADHGILAHGQHGLEALHARGYAGSQDQGGKRTADSCFHG